MTQKEIFELLWQHYRDHINHIKDWTDPIKMMEYIEANRLQFGVCCYADNVLDKFIYEDELVSTHKLQGGDYWGPTANRMETCRGMLSCLELRLVKLQQILNTL